MVGRASQTCCQFGWGAERGANDDPVAFGLGRWEKEQSCPLLWLGGLSGGLLGKLTPLCPAPALVYESGQAPKASTKILPAGGVGRQVQLNMPQSSPPPPNLAGAPPTQWGPRAPPGGCASDAPRGNLPCWLSDFLSLFSPQPPGYYRL